MNNLQIITLCSLPIAGGVIGWLTNYIAVKMIFRPHKSKKILFFSVWGLLPRRQTELAQTIGLTVERELFNHADFRKAVLNKSVEAAVVYEIEDQMDKFIGDKLLSNPLFAAFLQGDFATNLKQMFGKQVGEAVPGILSKVLDQAESNLDLKIHIQEKIEKLSFEKLEEIVYQVASKELKAIVFLGAFLGFFCRSNPDVADCASDAELIVLDFYLAITFLY